jgi:hypothetical protein
LRINMAEYGSHAYASMGDRIAGGGLSRRMAGDAGATIQALLSKARPVRYKEGYGV